MPFFLGWYLFGILAATFFLSQIRQFKDRPAILERTRTLKTMDVPSKKRAMGTWYLLSGGDSSICLSPLEKIKNMSSIVIGSL